METPSVSRHQKLVTDVLSWVFNVVTSVGIIVVNKYLMTHYNFTFAATLTGLHFIMTSLMTSALRLSGYLEPSQLPLMEQVKFALTANVSIVGMNVSLMWNSVGFYQIAKLGMIPVSCVLEVFFDSMRYSQGSRLSVLLVLLGVATCTIADSSLSARGMVAAAVAVCSTALQQYYVQYLQKKYRLGSFDLLSHTAPVQAGTLILLGPLIDWLLSGARFDSYDFSVPSVLCIGLSCLIAVAVNASQFICIGRFTAVTFQGLGHMKTICVLVLGYALFGLDGLSAPVVIGMLLSIMGMVWYGNASSRPGGKEKLPVAPTLPTTTTDSEEKAPLKSEPREAPVSALGIEKVASGSG
ncbi:hypothetical protein CLOM_g8115 [Closterium sp. NIES-68]|nr:hypothetical protein CLOM_g8115 [Closterium sp. NIES-68]GJP71134.1 hypothetical protein CLOP_g1982 [Closterium sp. NIES-67]